MLVDMVIDGADVPEGADHHVDHVGDLLVKIARRDQDAFAQLYDMMSSRVFGLILRVLVNRSLSEEVLQEVFLEVWQSAAKFAPNKGQGRSWLLTIAHRRAVDRVRASQASSDCDVRAGFGDLEAPRDDDADNVEMRIEGRRVTEARSEEHTSELQALMRIWYGVVRLEHKS